MRGRSAGIEAPVAGVARHVVGVVGGQLRGRGVVAAPPQHELLLAEGLLDLGLVLALEVPVVALVEAPVPPHREPAAAGSSQGDLGGTDGPCEHGGVQDPQVEVHTGPLGQELAGGPGLGLPLGGEVDVDPAGEAVLGVPGGLPVAQQDQVEHVSDRRRARRKGGNPPRPGRGVPGRRPAASL